MKDNIFIVVSEWESYDGNHDSEVIGVFYDLQKATKCLKAERDTILRESYATSFDKCNGVKAKGGDCYFFVTDEDESRWDSIDIYEKEVEQRDFIAIQFEYDGETFNERVYLDQIDREHYDDLWDWWFGVKTYSGHSELNFELLGEKDNDGNIIIDKFRINVYADESADDPMATISNYKLTKSWIGRKDGFVTDNE